MLLYVIIASQIEALVDGITRSVHVFESSIRKLISSPEHHMHQEKPRLTRYYPAFDLLS
jgi:hypothetical protein